VTRAGRFASDPRYGVRAIAQLFNETSLAFTPRWLVKPSPNKEVIKVFL